MGENQEEPDLQREDAIDIDDSDLLPLLSPLHPVSSATATASAGAGSSPDVFGHQTLGPSFPLRPCSQSSRLPSSPSPASRFQSAPVQEEERDATPRIAAAAAVKRRIPGPAGAVQEAMERRSSSVLSRQEDGSSLHDHRWDDQALELGLEDGDFKLSPWLCAMQFLGADAEWTSSISSIKTRTVERVPQVVGIVKFCSPNGLGDLFVTLKDPSGSIGASVHRRVLSEHILGGKIVVGCVLILKQVVAFCPSCSVCCLNVTKSNVVKLIINNCGPPSVRPMASVAAHCASAGKSNQAGSVMTRKELLLSNRTESCADEEFRRRSETSAVLGVRESVVSSSYNAAFATGTSAFKTCENIVGTGPHVEAGKPSARHKHTVQAQTASLESHMMMDEREAGHVGSFSYVANHVRAASRQTSAATDLHGMTWKFKGVQRQKDQRPVVTIDEESRTSSHTERRLAARSTDLPGIFVNADLTNVSAAVMPSKADHRPAGAKNQVSKVAAAQWTDEQLLELLSDYQDETDLF